MNKGVNTDIFRRLRNVVRTKSPPKWRTNSSFLLHNNAPAHWLVLVKNFLAENNVTTLEHPHTLLALLQLIFTCSFNWNQHWRDSAYVMLLTPWRMQDKDKKSFIKWLPWIFPTPLQLLAEVCSCIRGLFQRKCSLNDCTVFCFSEISDSRNILKPPYKIIAKFMYYVPSKYQTY
jgi:hypothetical protein